VTSLVIHILQLCIAVGDFKFTSYCSWSTNQCITLSIIDRDAVHTQFSPPLPDGGSPITLYMIEWDSKAAVSVNHRTTVLNVNANEIQSLTTSLRGVNEDYNI